MFVRAQRSATIRTRLDLERIRERVRAVVEEPPPEGFKAMMANGYFTGGTVGPRDFMLGYHFNSPKNPQTYDIHGTFRETPDWRFVRLDLHAQERWMSWWSLVGVLIFLGPSTYAAQTPLWAAVAIVAFVMGVYAFANLLWIPDTVTRRVAGRIAAELNGSVRHGRSWVVPQAS